jgi:hypothetical protein
LGCIFNTCNIERNRTDDFGVDAAEQAWLDDGAYQTHVLFGKLRDILLVMRDNLVQIKDIQELYYILWLKRLSKIFFIIVGLLGIYGMMISGTRGAIGAISWFYDLFCFKKNIKYLAQDILFLALVFVFFTMIANGNAQVRRMRTALILTMPPTGKTG